MRVVGRKEGGRVRMRQMQSWGVGERKTGRDMRGREHYTGAMQALVL